MKFVNGISKTVTALALVAGDAPNMRVREGTGFVSTLLWVTDGAPAELSGNADGADREIGVAPPEAGSIFRTVIFPPVSASGEKGVPTETGAARHPYMHRTGTIDYGIVLSGQITMLLDDEDIALQAKDTVIQRGTNHAWVNAGTEPCLMAFVLIDAKDPPELG